MRFFLYQRSLKLLAFILLPGSLFACDICGGFLGITPYDNQSNIGLYYRLRTFSNYYGSNTNATLLPSGNLKTTHQDHEIGGALSSDLDYEEYRVIELRGKFFLHEKVEFSISLPYNYNSSNYAGNYSYLNGAGDLTISSGWHFIHKTEKEKLMQRFVAGLGVKFPTGNYQIENKNEKRHSILMQPGTGTTDFLVQINYLAGYKRLGVNLISAYRINTQNKYNERAGNGFTSNLSVFYKLVLNNNWILVPSFQNYYEFSNGIYVNKENLPLTSMNVLYTGAGLDLFYKSIQWNCSVQIKAHEEKISEKMQSAIKITSGIIYNFKQKNYTIISNP
jgi:hypothetical protein